MSARPAGCRTDSKCDGAAEAAAARVLGRVLHLSPLQ